MDPFELRDGELLLSSPTAGDIDRITELCQDPEIQRWTTVPSPYTREDAVGFLERMVVPGWDKGSPTWALRLEGRLVGMVGLDAQGAGSAEIGYWLGPEARGRGVMGRAVALALDVAFGPLGLGRVEWRAVVGNWPSWRTAWRHGFRKEGQVRGLGVFGEERRDEWIGSLLRDDPREPAAPWDGPSPSARAESESEAASSAEAEAGAASSAEAAPGERPSSSVLSADRTGRDPDALVRQFHEHFGVPIADDAPSVDHDRVHLRMALVAEEFAELVAAVYGTSAGAVTQEAHQRALAADDGRRDVVGSADALADLVYVLYGMAQECGIPLPEVLAEVHAANLSKLGERGAVLREDGKVLRSPGYRPPDVAGVLARHRGTMAR